MLPCKIYVFYFEYIITDQLKVTDLHKIQCFTWDARSQWYSVGLALGISPDALDAIRRNHQGICEDCYTTILKQWLKEKPTLSSLAEALRSPSVNMGHLAEQLPPMTKPEHQVSCTTIAAIRV